MRSLHSCSGLVLLFVLRVDSDLELFCRPDKYVMQSLVCFSFKVIVMLAGFLLLTGCMVDLKISRGTLASSGDPTVGVLLSSTAPAANSLFNIPITIDFGSTSVTNLTAADFTVVNGTVENLSGSGTSYTLTLKPSATGQFTVTIQLPEGMVIATNGDTNTASNILSFDIDRDIFIVSFDTTKLSGGGSANDQVVIPLSDWEEYDIEVDWGDGAAAQTINFDFNDSYGVGSTPGEDRYLSHTFPSAGVYDITIKGTHLPNIQFCRMDDKLKIVDVKQWGSHAWQYLEDMFSGCTDVQISAEDAPNLAVVTNMRSMFANATNFNSPVEHWDTSNITQMSNVFSGAVKFNQPLAGWNTSNVTAMEAMFAGAEEFNQPIGGWDTSKVTTMNYMFADATAFNQPIGTWVTGAVTDMASMFSQADSFNQPIANWDTSSVTTMHGMFFGADVFDQPLNAVAGKWNTGNVIDMSNMFEEAAVFNRSLANWDTSKVTNMSAMFRNAAVFNGSLANWNTSALIDASSMFASALKFNQPLNRSGAIWNTGNVESMELMFTNAPEFNQDIGAWDVSKVTNMRRMFSQAAIFNQDLGAWVTSSALNMESMFEDAVLFSHDISGWDVDQVTNHTDFSAGTSAAVWPFLSQPAF